MTVGRRPGELGPEADEAARRALVVLAGYRGDAAAATAALDDPAPSVRVAAVGALVRCGALRDDLAGAALADPDPAVRCRAAVAAARAGVAVDRLLTLLGDPDDRVAEAAAFACGEHPDAGPVVVEHLARSATSHEDALVREAAVAAVGSLVAAGVEDPGDTGRAAVLAGLGDRATVRRRAVLALAAFEGPEVTAALRSRLDDRDLQVRQAAEELLAIEDGEAT